MKDNNINNLTEPPQKTSIEFNKRKMTTYEKKTWYPVNKIINIKRKNKNLVVFVILQIIPQINVLQVVIL